MIFSESDALVCIELLLNMICSYVKFYASRVTIAFIALAMPFSISNL